MKLAKENGHCDLIKACKYRRRKRGFKSAPRGDRGVHERS
jgi:hypothetical protein